MARAVSSPILSDNDVKDSSCTFSLSLIVSTSEVKTVSDCFALAVSSAIDLALACSAPFARSVSFCSFSSTSALALPTTSVSTRVISDTRVVVSASIFSRKFLSASNALLCSTFTALSAYSLVSAILASRSRISVVKSSRNACSAPFARLISALILSTIALILAVVVDTGTYI